MQAPQHEVGTGLSEEIGRASAWHVRTEGQEMVMGCDFSSRRPGYSHALLEASEVTSIPDSVSNEFLNFHELALCCLELLPRL